MLDDLDIGDRRLTIAGRVRPLDDLSMKLLLDWLEHRRSRWPNTANLHLLINHQTATATSRASNHWIRAAMRGQDATLERLRCSVFGRGWTGAVRASRSPRVRAGLRVSGQVGTRRRITHVG